MKYHQSKSRNSKINFLKRFQQGKASIHEIMPMDTNDFWLQHEPGIFINQKTGVRLTENEMGHEEYWITFEWLKSNKPFSFYWRHTDRATSIAVVAGGFCSSSSGFCRSIDRLEKCRFNLTPSFINQKSWGRTVRLCRCVGQHLFRHARAAHLWPLRF